MRGSGRAVGVGQRHVGEDEGRGGVSSQVGRPRGDVECGRRRADV